MNPRQFEYFSPETIDEAVSLLAKNEGAKVLAGGHSLIPLMKLRIANPDIIVDINGIRDLSYIREDRSAVSIGALTRLSDIQFSPVLGRLCPMMQETASVIADPQVRNRGTIGGNIAHGDPANDFPPATLALGASFQVVGPRGKHLIRAEDFFIDLFTVRMDHDEILTEVIIPVAPSLTGSSYLKFERKIGDFSTVSVASQLTFDKEGKIRAAGIGMGGVGPTALKAKEAEQALLGNKPSDELIQEAASECAKASSPVSDLRGSAEYKKEMVSVFAQRSLKKAAERAFPSGA